MRMFFLGMGWEERQEYDVGLKGMVKTGGK